MSDEPKPGTLESVQRIIRDNQEWISWQAKQQADWLAMLRHLTDRHG